MGEAGTPVLARSDTAGVRAHAAVLAGVAQGAGAGVVVHTVLAGAGVLAGARGTVINVDLAVGTGEARLTATQHTLTQVQTFPTYKEGRGTTGFSIRSRKMIKEGALTILSMTVTVGETNTRKKN